MGRNGRKAFTASGGIIALTLMLASPAGATVKWVCDVPGEGSVTFVSVPDAARHGIETANQYAGATFKARFGEICTVIED